MQAWILVHVFVHVSLCISNTELCIFNALVQIIKANIIKWEKCALVYVCACICMCVCMSGGAVGADTGITLTNQFNVSWANMHEETTPCDRVCV